MSTPLRIPSWLVWWRMKWIHTIALSYSLIVLFRMYPTPKKYSYTSYIPTVNEHKWRRRVCLSTTYSIYQSSIRDRNMSTTSSTVYHLSLWMSTPRAASVYYLSTRLASTCLHELTRIYARLELVVDKSKSRIQEVDNMSLIQQKGDNPKAP
jgi:hypothetical protein